MTDTASPQPMTDADVTASNTATAADTTSSPGGAPERPGSGGSAPEGVGAGAMAEAGGETGAGEGATGDEASPASIKQTLTDKTAEFRGQATDKVRQFAEDGKSRATGAIDDLAKMLSEAADQVDEKLGGQFGQYARSTADHVQGFSSTLNEKSIDDMVEMAREFVRKSPAAAIGIATALGFVIARLAAAGLEQRDHA
jgi:ElaB/YqjD/DUF883 family membrane-anchored ribosome-binding protein